MTFLEEQAGYIQDQKERASLDPENPRDRLLTELADTMSLLCHQLYSVSSVITGLRESIEELQDLLIDETDEPMPADEYFDTADSPLYEIKCPQCGDRFAVDETTLMRGFSCPECGEKLIASDNR